MYFIATKINKITLQTLRYVPHGVSWSALMNSADIYVSYDIL